MRVTVCRFPTYSKVKFLEDSDRAIKALIIHYNMAG